MSGGRIVIVSGPPGAGKSTVARRLAESADAPLAVHLHSDDFYAYIRKGYVAPWKSESRAQNTIVLDALAASAAIYAEGGYEVFVDGIVGPWFFDPWLRVAREQALNVHYVLLLPDLPTTLARATARSAPALTDPQPIEFMWQQFAQVNGVNDHAFDTSQLTVEQTVEAVRAAIESSRLMLPTQSSDRWSAT